MYDLQMIDDGPLILPLLATLGTEGQICHDGGGHQGNGYPVLPLF